MGVLWLISGPMVMPPGQLITVMEPGWEAEPRHTPTLPWRSARVLGESTELRVHGSGPRLAQPLPCGSPGLPESPFWVCFSFIKVSVRMECCGLGKARHTVDAQQAVARPASCQCLGGPRPPGGKHHHPFLALWCQLSSNDFEF